MRISELPLTTNPTSTDDLPIDRSGVTYRVKYEALRGPQGDPGEDGTIENLDVTATTLPAGSQATASYENNLLTLGIPQGAKGDPGDDGQDGVGVPSGGTTGQVLKKKSGTDYDTEWGNATGGTWGSITGTLSNQSDLQMALNAKADTNNIPTKTSDLTNDSGFITNNVSGSLSATGDISAGGAISATGSANFYGGIGSFGSDCGLQVRQMDGVISGTTGGNSVNLTADVPSGYTFLCWISAASHGWVGYVYPASSIYSTVNFWTNESGNSGGNRPFRATYLCFKSGS